MDISIIKPIRETVDWLLGKFKSAKDHHQKEQINKIAQQIVKLIVNKSLSSTILKNMLESENEHISVYKIRESIFKTEEDLRVLHELLEESNMNIEHIPFTLNLGLSELTNHKMVRIDELKTMISNGNFGIKEQEKMLEDLNNFNIEWTKLGEEIDQLFREANKD